MVNNKTLKHCENLLQVSNEIKQYVKITIAKFHEWHCASFPNWNCNKTIFATISIDITPMS